MAVRYRPLSHFFPSLEGVMRLRKCMRVRACDYTWAAATADTLQDLFAYDFTSGEWEDLSIPSAGNFPPGRRHAMMEVYDGKLLVFGGNCPLHRLSL